MTSQNHHDLTNLWVKLRNNSTLLHEFGIDTINLIDENLNCESLMNMTVSLIFS